jgi:hypothetical protein
MRDQLLDTLNLSITNTPLTSGDVSKKPYIALSLIDRGLADTRALAIGRALENGDLGKLAGAICECDSSNFPRLVKLEPRLFELLLSDESVKGYWRVLSERLEEVLR